MSYCSASCTSVRSPLIAAIATFALKADVWFRRGLLLMLSPDSRANLARCQAEAPLIALCRYSKPALFAFAEEKSPEQHREESNQMLGVEGVQKMELTRVVASGINQRIYFFYAVHPDCFASDINIRVTKQPEHGTVETAAATDFPNFGRESIRYRCNQHKVRGQQVNYKSAEKYIGSDTFELLVLFPG